MTEQLQVVAREHLAKVTDVEVEYYPDHEPRTESVTFRHTKELGHKAGLVCAISGQPNPEYHHLFIEWADAAAVDWQLMKDIANGRLLEWHVLDPVTDQPTEATVPIEMTLIWVICRITTALGFDWHAFDPAKPETFIDSPQNMLPLSAKFHRASTHGIHHRSWPTWVFQAWPRIAGFVFTPDEVAQHDQVKP